MTSAPCVLCVCVRTCLTAPRCSPPSAPPSSRASTRWRGHAVRSCGSQSMRAMRSATRGATPTKSCSAPSAPPSCATGCPRPSATCTACWTSGRRARARCAADTQGVRGGCKGTPMNARPCQSAVPLPASPTTTLSMHPLCNHRRRSCLTGVTTRLNGWTAWLSRWRRQRQRAQQPRPQPRASGGRAWPARARHHPAAAGAALLAGG